IRARRILREFEKTPHEDLVRDTESVCSEYDAAVAERAAKQRELAALLEQLTALSSADEADWHCADLQQKIDTIKLWLDSGSKLRRSTENLVIQLRTVAREIIPLSRHQSWNSQIFVSIGRWSRALNRLPEEVASRG